MDINSLTIGQAKEIAALVAGAQVEPQQSPALTVADGRYVIVRSRDAGVIFGKLDATDGSTIHLSNAVQMWKWHAAQGGTLIDVATHGVKASGCKFSVAQAKVTVFNACALIDVTDDAAASILSVKSSEWK